MITGVKHRGSWDVSGAEEARAVARNIRGAAAAGTAIDGNAAAALKPPSRALPWGVMQGTWHGRARESGCGGKAN